MLAIPGATIARSPAPSSSAAWAKTSFEPTLSGIHTVGYRRRSYSRMAAPASAAVNRWSAKLQTPTRPRRAARARPPIPPMPAMASRVRGGPARYHAPRARSPAVVAASLPCAHRGLPALVPARARPPDLRLVRERRLPAARLGPGHGSEAAGHERAGRADLGRAHAGWRVGRLAP